MKVDSISDEATALSFKSLSTSHVAKQAILKWFKSLEFGTLTLVDGDQTYSFGECVADNAESKNNSAEKDNVSATVIVNNQEFYSEILFGGAVGSGESYMRGNWSSPSLVDAIRVLAKNLHALEQLNSKSQVAKKLFLRAYSFFTMNSIKGSKKNIAAHYDLGNDFFSLFLDPTMMYSSGLWLSGGTEEEDGQDREKTHKTTLEQASLAKLETICQKIDLQKTDHVIEIGTGWGGFAIYAASQYGCRVTTTTISKQQYDYASAKVKALNLDDKVTVIMQDYRELEGSYDKLVSIEMVEAVGHKFLPSFFKQCSRLLNDKGLMLLQAITISDQRYNRARKTIDFIQRYIFPGGCLPSNFIVSKNIAQQTDMQIVDTHDITHDYALTLRHWRERFLSELPTVKQQGFDDIFIRMWEFYFCYCEGAFRERVIQTSQFLVAKPSSHYRSTRVR